jgi:hypothetical protein
MMELAYPWIDRLLWAAGGFVAGAVTATAVIWYLVW